MTQAGREEVQAFLTRKWSKEQGYRLKKHLWAFEVLYNGETPFCIICRHFFSVDQCLQHWESAVDPP